MKKARKRLGRGLGSGHGAYSGRGIKGQKARTGGAIRPGFEGGRMPLVRQIPKTRGFKSFHAKSAPLFLPNLLKAFEDGSLVTPKSLKEKGFVESVGESVKIVGKIKVTKKINFQGLKLSAGAKASVEAAGGKVSDAK